MSRSLRTSLAVLTLAFAFAAGCGNAARKESIERTNAGNKALGAKQFDTAINEYKEAVRALRDNHAAHYYMGEAYRMKKEYDKASEAYAESVRIKPGNVMYQMMYGVALYENEVAKGRERQAKPGQKPAEVQVDYSLLNFDQAEQHLLEAVKINPDLFFEHAYLGKIYRATGRPREAAEAYSKAVVANPREWAPYVALGELYRRWDYPNEAIQVLTQGVEHVPGQVEKGELHYVLGMAYTDNHDDDKAIESFTASIDANKDKHIARFMRGQALYRKGQWKAADKDLEQFAKSAGPGEAANKSIAQKLRFSLAAKLQGG